MSTHMMHGNDSLYFNYGDDARGEIITDNQNNVYVGTCTFSTDFPVTSSAFQPNPGGKRKESSLSWIIICRILYGAHI